MALRQVRVTASDMKNGLKRAMKLLKTDSDNIIMEKVGEKEFKANVINADAEIHIKINKTALTASIKRVIPSSGCFD
jgi:hypothetical protein